MSNAYSRERFDVISFYGGDREMDRLWFMLITITIGCYDAMRILVVNVWQDRYNLMNGDTTSWQCYCNFAYWVNTYSGKVTC